MVMHQVRLPLRIRFRLILWSIKNIYGFDRLRVEENLLQLNCLRITLKKENAHKFLVCRNTFHKQCIPFVKKNKKTGRLLIEGSGISGVRRVKIKYNFLRMVGDCIMRNCRGI